MGGKRKWREEGKEKSNDGSWEVFLGGKLEKGRGSGGRGSGGSEWELECMYMYTFCTCPLKAILALSNAYNV